MITIYDWFGYDLTISERYKLIKEVGFDGVLMWWGNGLGRDTFGENDYRNGPGIARESGLIIENIHAPLENYNSLWLDDLSGESLTECYLQCVKDCAEFEIPTMVVHLPKDDYNHNILGLDRIKRITESAEKNEINIAFENLRNLTNLSYVLESVDSNRVGFCYDSAHHYKHYPEIDLVTKYKSRLMAIHLHDDNGIQTQHKLPFDGTINWLKVMNGLASIDYKGALAIEGMNWAYKDLSAREYLQEAFNRAKKLDKLKSESLIRGFI